MNMVNNQIKSYLWLGVLLIGTVLLTINGLYSLVNIIFFTVFLFLLIYNRKTVLFLFVALLPTNGFISTEYNIFGIIHTTYIIYFITFLALIKEWRTLTKQEKNYVKQSGKYISDITVLLVFFSLYAFLLNIKKDLLDLEEIPLALYVTRTFKLLFLFGNLFFVIKLSRLPLYWDCIRRGFIISLVLISFGAIFSNLWSDLGIYLGSEDVQNFGFEIRRSGFWGLFGDENSLAGFLAVGFAYTIFHNHKNYNWVLLIISLGVLSTGSRTGSLNIAISLIIYLFANNIKLPSKINLFIFLVIVTSYGMYLGFFDNIIGRFMALENGEDKTLDSTAISGRVGGWVFYMSYIFSNFRVFLIGTDESIYKTLGINFYERVAHNFFIQLWYYWGVIALLFFLNWIKRVIKRIRFTNDKSVIFAIIIPFTITLFTVSDTGVFIAFILAFTCSVNSNITDIGNKIKQRNYIFIDQKVKY